MNFTSEQISLLAEAEAEYWKEFLTKRAVELGQEIARLRLCLQEISDLRYGGATTLSQALKFGAALKIAEIALSRNIQERPTQ